MSMVVKIGAFSGELPANLGLNKEYQATRIGPNHMDVTCDDGQVIRTHITKSGWLGDCGEWEIVSEKI